MEGLVLGLLFGPLGVLVESNLPEIEDNNEKGDGTFAAPSPPVG
jgi:hypothetical protein